MLGARRANGATALLRARGRVIPKARANHDERVELRLELPSDGKPTRADLRKSGWCHDCGGRVALMETRPIASSYYQTFILPDLAMDDDELHLTPCQNYPLATDVVEGERWAGVARTAMTAFRWHAPLPGLT